MIRVHKSSVAPASLASKTRYDGRDVLEQLEADAHGKCYLCERRLTADFEVEHLKSQKNYGKLTCDWNNLLWGCGYCNRKKGDNYDDVLNPVTVDIEDEISQVVDFVNKKVIFTPTGTSTLQHELTIKLLSSIFNGLKLLRTKREQNFYNYVASRISTFQNLIVEWLKNPCEETREPIIEELFIESELLGLKYWIVKSNPTVETEFGKYTVWTQ